MKHPRGERDASMIGSFDGGPSFSPAPLPSFCLPKHRVNGSTCERGRLVYNSLPLLRTIKIKSRRGPRPYRLSIGTAALSLVTAEEFQYLS